MMNKQFSKDWQRSPHLGHVVETHQDDGGDEEAGGDDQQKDIAEVEKLLVVGGPSGPGLQGFGFLRKKN